DAFMTDEELKRISQFKITSIESFDDPSVNWPGDQDWREDLLGVIQSLEALELRRQEDEEQAAEEKQQEKERAAEVKRQEKERAAEAKRQEKERVAEAKRQEKERERERKAQEKQDKKQPTKKQKTTHQAETDSSFFHLTPPSGSSQPIASTLAATNSHSTPAPTARIRPHTPAPAQGRAVQRAFISANGQLVTVLTGGLPAYNHYP
ncbi:hypothetical protein FRC06_006795, partial [Ceratobasidium sp. 370]